MRPDEGEEDIRNCLHETITYTAAAVLILVITNFCHH